jgi:hypothetical protein
MHGVTTPPDNSASAKPVEIAIAGVRYRIAPYSPPEPGALYSVRDKRGAERIIQVSSAPPDAAVIEVRTLDNRRRSNRPIRISADSLARQAAKGWCSRLLRVAENAPPAAEQPEPPPAAAATMRLDVQNFSRCCADIARAGIKFDTQLIKDVADGPFRAGNYNQAFIHFEQFALGFTSAVAASRRAIAEGRRALAAQKTKLSGKEIQERTAAFVRSEQLINAAERSFSTILEGLRMYLRAQPE